MWTMPESKYCHHRARSPVDMSVSCRGLFQDHPGDCVELEHDDWRRPGTSAYSRPWRIASASKQQYLMRLLYKISSVSGYINIREGLYIRSELSARYRRGAAFPHNKFGAHINTSLTDNRKLQISKATASMH